MVADASYHESLLAAVAMRIRSEIAIKRPPTSLETRTGLTTAR